VQFCSHTLQPLYQQIGVAWEAPEGNPYRIITSRFAGAAAGFPLRPEESD
jgi:hypothetical protein